MKHKTLTEQDKQRFSRHLNIPEFGEDEQLRLKSGSVLIVGMGGLGSPASLYLAAAGIGTLGLCDFDRIEQHNLQRQVLYQENQVGCSKVDTAEQRLTALYPDLEVIKHGEGIGINNAMEILENYDVVIDATDNFGTRYLLNDAAYLSKTPLVSGSVFRVEGQVVVFNHEADAPCYRCLFPQRPDEGLAPNCAESGVIGAICGVVGSLQAMEAIKLLSGLGSPLKGRMVKMSLFDNRYSVFDLEKSSQCHLCGDHPRIVDLNSEDYTGSCLHTLKTDTQESNIALNSKMNDLPLEIDVSTAAQMIESDGAKFLDVREPDEVMTCQIPGSATISMGRIPESVDAIDRDKPVIVYCHHGMRSLRVVHFLRNQGFSNCTSMKGGIHQWAVEQDPEMKRY